VSEPDFEGNSGEGSYDGDVQMRDQMIVVMRNKFRRFGEYS
jgi:hypothetical protein